MKLPVELLVNSKTYENDFVKHSCISEIDSFLRLALLKEIVQAWHNVTQVQGRQRHQDCEFWVSLNYKVTPDHRKL